MPVSNSSTSTLQLKIDRPLESLLPTYEQMEQEANQFAAELLMPEVIVRRLVEKYATDCRGDDLNWRLATEMLVSGTAMKRRLRELQLPQIDTVHT